MNDTADLTTQENPSSPEEQRSILPLVDIFEDDTGITLQADLPGVSQDRLDIQIDNDSLSIAGNIKFDLSEHMDALYADVRASRYQRSFALSRELDRDNIEASLKDGVLTLRIPKLQEHRARKIEVRTG
jgi:HSP20 family protein